MGRWKIAWAGALVAAILILFARASSPGLLEDSDTKAALAGIRERQAPLSWFTSDWPLGNHFYRPVSTLFFELDNALSGDDAAGYGFTNAALCAASVLLLAWLLRELTDTPWMTLVGSLLFAGWHLGWFGTLAYWVTWSSWVVLALGLWRHRLDWRRWLPAFLAVGYLGFELGGMVDLYARMIAWIPGRTASVMTVFCLLAMAAYVRYERTSALRAVREPGPLDPPKTRSARLDARAARFPVGLAGLSLLATALALASYEQAVMLPATMVGLAVAIALQGYRPRWGWQIGFWGLLVLYFVVRREFVPSSASGYQLQQFRDGPGVWGSLSEYILPVTGQLPQMAATWSAGPLILLTGVPYGDLLTLARNVGGLLAFREAWRWALTGWALSLLAYLPMAWMKQFDHYHYWPMALRSLYVVALMIGTWRLVVIAASPPAAQAPPRPTPAPGSLRHP